MTTNVDGYEYTELDLKIIAGIHKAVEDRGRDWVYPRFEENEKGEEVYNKEWTRAGDCLYVKDDLTPACIVGYALVEAGIPARDMQVLEDAEELVRAHLSLDVSERMTLALDRAQSVQDRGGSWGEAVDAFGKVLATGKYHS